MRRTCADAAERRLGAGKAAAKWKRLAEASRLPLGVRAPAGRPARCPRSEEWRARQGPAKRSVKPRARLQPHGLRDPRSAAGRRARTARSSSRRPSSARCWRYLLLSHRDDGVSMTPPDRRAVGRRAARRRRPRRSRSTSRSCAGRSGRENPIVTRAVRLRDRDRARRSSTSSASRRWSRAPTRAAPQEAARAAARGARALPRPAAGRRAAARPGRDRGRPARRSCAWPRSSSGSTPTSRSAATRALVAELEALTAEHPYRERFHAQLMLALYRSGRQADALDAYRRARATLVEELGLEPGRELQRLEAAILAQDPALDLAASPPPAPRRRGAAPALPGARRRRCSAATRTSRPPPRCSRPRRPAAHADRAGRDRQDPLRARARPPARRRVPGRRPLRRPRRARRSRARARRARAGRRPPGAASSSTTSSRCWRRPPISATCWPRRRARS